MKFFIVILCGCIVVNVTPLSAPTATTPKYQTVKDFRKCLSPSTATTWCLPDKKPVDCCEQSWKELNGLQVKEKPSTCPKPPPPPPPPPPLAPPPAGPPAAFTLIKGYEKCVADHPLVKGQKCLASGKPAGCCQDSWDKLKRLVGREKLYTCPLVIRLVPPPPPPPPAATAPAATPVKAPPVTTPSGKTPISTKTAAAAAAYKPGIKHLM